MTLGDLGLVLSVLLLAAVLVGIVVSVIGRRPDRTRWLAGTAAVYVVGYAALLLATARAVPRRIYAVGTRRCFDDWCVATGTVRPVDSPAGGGARWRTVLTVSSVARRVRQRAPDAHVELEDETGRRYPPSTAGRSAGQPTLTDELEPGEMIAVPLVFDLPPGAVPAGLILHHGDVPGFMIIGSEQSVLHPPSLMQVAVMSDH